MINPIRFGGMASGLDTESLVKQLVAAEKMKVNKITQQRIYKTWQQEAFNSINKSTANFIIESRKKLELTRTTSNGSLLPGSYQNMSWVNKATSSNESSFSVSATAAASPGSYDISVDALAKGVTLASEGNVTAANIGSLPQAAGNDITIRIKSNTDTDFKDIKLLKTDTMSEAAKKISDATGLNVKFDTGAQRFFMSTATTGADAKIEFDLDATTGLNTKAFLEDIKFTSEGSLVPAINTGEKAVITFQGATIEYDSNNINILGIDINLKAAAPGVIEQLNVSTDIDGAVDKIKEFVDEYNKLVDNLNTKLNEKQYRDYRPLTDEQRADMKEEDTKLWDQKAKSGLLRGDSSISSMLGTMRSGLYESVNDMVLDEGTGEYKAVAGTTASLYEFGITTGNYRDNGKLTIDEDKLRKALTDNPDKVIKTLFKSSSIEEQKISSTDTDDERKAKVEVNKYRRQDSGVFTRLYDDMITGMKSIVDKSGPGDDATLLRSVKSNILIDFVTKGSRSILDKDILDIVKSIDRENARLTQVENRYWNKFTALETAMSKMNSQSSWLAQQFGGGM